MEWQFLFDICQTAGYNRSTLNCVHFKKKYLYAQRRTKWKDWQKSGLRITNFKSWYPFFKHPYTHSLPLLFDETAITKAEVVNDKMYLKLDNYTKLTFSGIKILEEEISVDNTDVKMIELHKMQDCHELHLLLEKIDENFIKNYYYATYAFKDLKMSSK